MSGRFGDLSDVRVHYGIEFTAHVIRGRNARTAWFCDFCDEEVRLGGKIGFSLPRMLNRHAREHVADGVQLRLWPKK